MSALCRGCLARAPRDSMKDMIEQGLCASYGRITSVQVKRSEGLSELLCGACEAALLECLRFRVRCQKSDLLLRSDTSQKYSTVVAQTTQTVETEPTPAKREKRMINYEFSNEKLTLRITPEDLDSRSDGDLVCPHGCKTLFKKRNLLLTHLVKQHGIDDSKFTLDIQYYCPYTTCPYEMDSEKNKYFQLKKALKSHILNLHTSKNFACEKCEEKFATESAYERHAVVCNMRFVCAVCDIEYKTNDRLVVHLMRKHPDMHKEYKRQNKQLKQQARHSKRPLESAREAKKIKTDKHIERQTFKNITADNLYDSSPKRTFATQTFDEKCVRNDISLSSCVEHSPQFAHKNDEFSLCEERASSTIETQTVFEDLLSMRSQNSEDDSIFETVSLSDIQTQTWPLEFDSSPLKKKNSSETQTNPFMTKLNTDLNPGLSSSPDLSFKETQTCFCFLDSPRPSASHFNFPKTIFDSATSSPVSCTTSTMTQTADPDVIARRRDVLLSFNSIETQTGDVM